MKIYTEYANIVNDIKINYCRGRSQETRDVLQALNDIKEWLFKKEMQALEKKLDKI